MNITLWFRKLYAALQGIFSGGQPEISPQTTATNQEQPKTNLDQSQMKEYFLDLSVALAGFSKFDLQGTGQADLYYSTVEQNIGNELFQELLQAFHNLDLKAKSANDQSILDQGVRSEILESEKFSVIAHNIIKLWYVATWYPLTQPENKSDEEPFIVSPQAYPEGLLWRSIGVNPPAAKAPGYGTWSEKPCVT
ncbi:MAG: hypothetical protein WBM86_08940, partial [Waterburya sp.]